jgi:ribonucleoside-diphosphate reductase alpha chain
MKKLGDRDPEAMGLWLEILKSRMETGEPYIMFKDNVNKNNPLAYAMNNLDVTMTNICTEITLHTDEEHSFICCLSSLNLAKYDEWKECSSSVCNVISVHMLVIVTSKLFIAYAKGLFLLTLSLNII